MVPCWGMLQHAEKQKQTPSLFTWGRNTHFSTQLRNSRTKPKPKPEVMETPLAAPQAQLWRLLLTSPSPSCSQPRLELLSLPPQHSCISSTHCMTGTAIHHPAQHLQKLPALWKCSPRTDHPHWEMKDSWAPVPCWAQWGACEVWLSSTHFFLTEFLINTWLRRKGRIMGCGRKAKKYNSYQKIQMSFEKNTF